MKTLGDIFDVTISCCDEKKEISPRTTHCVPRVFKDVPRAYQGLTRVFMDQNMCKKNAVETPF